MKRILLAIPVLGSLLGGSAHATDVGVSIGIGQPGFYGQVDIGGYPRPTLVYPQPVLIERAPVHRPPIYLNVPPGHARHWSKHCHRYGACGEPVYFVQNHWYNRVYVPHYRNRHGHGHYGDGWEQGPRGGKHHYRPDDHRGHRHDR